jgi:hypothetical protein
MLDGMRCSRTVAIDCKLRTVFSIFLFAEADDQCGSTIDDATPPVSRHCCVIDVTGTLGMTQTPGFVSPLPPSVVQVSTHAPNRRQYEAHLLAPQFHQDEDNSTAVAAAFQSGATLRT